MKREKIINRRIDVEKKSNAHEFENTKIMQTKMMFSHDKLGTNLITEWGIEDKDMMIGNSELGSNTLHIPGQEKEFKKWNKE